MAGVAAGVVVGRPATVVVFGVVEAAGALAVVVGMAALPTGAVAGPLTFVAGVHGTVAFAVVAAVGAAFFLWNKDPKFEMA